MVLKVSIAGVRGDVNIGLTPEVIMNMSLAYGTYMKKSRIVIGTDTRPTGEMVKGIVISALLATGCKVLDIGIAPTPVVAYMVKHLNYAGGIIISASHNDIKYNALKLLNRIEEIALYKGELQDLQKLVKKMPTKRQLKEWIGNAKSRI